MSGWSSVRSWTSHAPALVRVPEVSADPDTSSAPWQALCPPQAPVLRDPDVSQVRRTRPGQPVVLVSDRLGGRRRLRRTARLGGLLVDRELLVLPGTRRTLVTVDEDPTAVRHLWDSVAAVPPGLTWAALPVTGILHLGRRMPWRWTGAVVGGHVLIGRRP